MSDQATVWKFAFGVLVLLLSGMAFFMRKNAEPPDAMPLPAQAASAPAPLPAASAPPDVPEAQEPPVRIRIALREPSGTAKRHNVRATHRLAHRRHHVSPYVAGRQHYPFDPRERWRPREG